MPTFPKDEYDVRARNLSRSHVGLFQSCLPYAIVVCTLFTTACAGDKSPKVLAEWRIEENGLPPIVSVEVNGRPLVMEIDTGASISTIRELHRFAFTGKSRNYRVQLADRQIEKIAYSLKSLSAQRWNAHDEDVSLPKNRDIVLHLESNGIDGILSSGALKNVCLQIDYDNETCRFLSEYTALEDEASFHLKMAGGVPWIHSRIGEYADLIVDTGDSLGFMWPGNLSPELVDGRDYIRWRNPIVDKQDVSRERILLRHLTIGDSDLRVENVQGRPAEIATIGLQVLSQFRMTIDYPNAMLYLAPRKTPHKVLAPDASGIALLKDKQGYYVWFVYDGTPASEAGLKREDRILTVQGRPATQLTFHELEGLFTQGGKAVTLGLERNGTRFERRLALRFPIEYPPKWPERKTVVRTIPPD